MDEVAQFVRQANGAFPSAARADQAGTADHRIIHRPGVGDLADQGRFCAPEQNIHSAVAPVTGHGDLIDRGGQFRGPIDGQAGITS